MRRTLAAIVFLTVVVATAAVRGDEVVFNNGDRLTGTVRTTGDGKIVIAATDAGDVTVDLKKVRSIRTDAAVPLRFADGREATAALVSEDGYVTVDGRRYAVTALTSINAPPVRWTGSVTVNGALTRGNSVTESLGVDAEVARRTDLHRVSLGAEYYFARQKDPDTGDRTTSADAWELFGKYDYYFTDDFYGFGQLTLEKDRIADLQLRATPSVGVGYEWIDEPDRHFSTEAGLTWVYEDYDGADPTNHVGVRLAYHADRSFNDKVKVFHNLEYLPSVEDEQDFNVNADAGLRASLTDGFYSEVKAEWKYDSSPAPDAHKNDFRLLVGLGYAF